MTGVVFLTFILGTFYRSASLYHPQRRAILHLKNQKRKIKDKNKTDDGPPFFDFSTLKSKTVRILLVSTGISAFGINTPIFYLVKRPITRRLINPNRKPFPARFETLRSDVNISLDKSPQRNERKIIFPPKYSSLTL